MPISIRDIEKKCDCINKKLFFCAKEKYFSKLESNKEFTIEKYKFLHDGDLGDLPCSIVSYGCPTFLDWLI